MKTLSYTIAKENLKALGLYAKGIAIGIAEFGMKLTNTILGTKLWKEHDLKDKNKYQAQAGVSGYQIGFAIPFMVFILFLIGLVSVPVAKAYIALQVVTVISIYIYQVAYPLTRDLINFYNREVCHEGA